MKIWFSEPVAGVAASDLTINGIPAVSAMVPASRPYTFTFSNVPTGTVVVVLASDNNIHDFATTPNAFSGKSWTYVINPDLLRYVIHISIDGCVHGT